MLNYKTMQFANGCFWGTEHVFRRHFKERIDKIKVGYTGGTVPNPTYRQVCTGTTGHAEAVEIEFSPEKVSYPELVEFFFAMHDPTTLNRQGNDVGTQYRSAIFTHSDEQINQAKSVMEAVQKERYPGKKIITQIEPAKEFWVAEKMHQDYLENNPGGYECPLHYVRWNVPKR